MSTAANLTVHKSAVPTQALIDQLYADVGRRDDSGAAALLADCDLSVAIAVILKLSARRGAAVLAASRPERRSQLQDALPTQLVAQWERNGAYPQDSVGRLMEPTEAIFAENLSVGEVIDALRPLVAREFVTYAYAVNTAKALTGVVVMRDLLFADRSQRLSEITVKNPFVLSPEVPVLEAMKEVVSRHFPVYPVCDATGAIVGVVRGFRLFEEQAIEISAQPGRMVGVEKEESVQTHWLRSFKYRHPWLQLNLLTAFVAGAVVSVFQDTINEIVVLASFLPVLAGQSGNTGCQSLAVTLRGMTLGQIGKGQVRAMLTKEALLGLMNGLFVGVSAGTGMFILASSQRNPNALELSLVVLVAMSLSCVVSGLSGALVPMALKKLGADPATASSIFLTTATDVASMGLLLSLATWVIL